MNEEKDTTQTTENVTTITNDSSKSEEENKNENEQTVVDEESTVDPNSRYGKFLAAMNTLGKYLKVPINALFKCTGFFIFVYLVAWTLNAIYSNIHFDLSAIRDFYLMVIGKNLGEHGINSLLNSDKGQMPTNRGK